MRQAKVNTDHVFTFRPTRLPAAAPSVRVVIGTTDVTLAMAVVRAAANVTAVAPGGDSVSTDATGAAARGLVGDHGGHAWLDLGAHGVFPVEVLEVLADGTAVLASPLPSSVVTTATGTLAWNIWSVTIPAATIGVAVNRAARWSVTYTADLGADHPGESMHDGGPLRVVPRPFSTGLTHAELLRHVPTLYGRVPPAQQSYQPQIESIGILGLVEARLPSGGYADQTLGAQWQRAHALFVAAHLAEIGYLRAEDPDRPRALADAELARQSSRIAWLDLDDDGAVDAGETLPQPASFASIIRSHSPTLEAEYAAGTRERPSMSDDR